MISLHRSLSPAFFRHPFTSRVLISFNTESGHLNLGLLFFLLPSGWEKVICMQGTLSSILATGPNHFNVAILIILTMFGSLYKLHSSSLCFTLQTPLTQICNKFFLKSFFQTCEVSFNSFCKSPALTSVEHHWSN